MRLVKQYLWGIKTLLAHFHGVTRGALVFEPSPTQTPILHKLPPNANEDQLEAAQAMIQEVQNNR